MGRIRRCIGIAAIWGGVVSALFWAAAETAWSLEPPNSPTPALRLKMGDSIGVFGLKPLVEKKGDRTLFIDEMLGPKAEKPPKALLLGFFASWCPPCLKEFPEIKKLAEKHKSAGLEIVLIAIDQENQGIKKARDFVVRQKPSFPVLLDRYNIVVRRFFEDDASLPSLFLIDGRGKLLEAFVGETPLPKVETAILPHLK